MKFTTALLLAGSAMMVAAQTTDTATEIPEFKTESLLALNEFCEAHTNLCKYVVIDTPSFMQIPAEDAEEASEPLEKRAITRPHRKVSKKTPHGDRKHKNGKRMRNNGSSLIWRGGEHKWTFPFDFLISGKGQGNGDGT